MATSGASALSVVWHDGQCAEVEIVANAVHRCRSGAKKRAVAMALFRA